MSSPEGTHVGRPIGPVAGFVLDMHGRDNAVPIVNIPKHVRRQVAPAGPIPHMMMRIDDLLMRIECFFTVKRQPVVVDGRIAHVGAD